MPNECLRPDMDYLLNVLKDLVGFRTVAPPGNYYPEIVDYLIPIFNSMGFKTNRIEMPEDVFQAKCSG